MKKNLLLTVLVLLIALGYPSITAQAHLIDSANIDQYTRLEPGLKSIRVHYILNMGNFPAYLERRAIDTNVDAQVSDAEREVYLAKKIAELLAAMSLKVDGAPIELHVVKRELSFPILDVPDIDGGLMTMLLVLDLDAPLPELTQATRIEYSNENYPDDAGWREIVVRPLDGLTLDDPALEQEQSNELQVYPPGMSSMLDMRSVTFQISPGGTAQPTPTQTTGLPRTPQPDDQFAGLIAAPELTPQVILFSLLLSLVLGAAHALTPGHGKTIVGAYLVGNRGKASHAVLLGLTTTLTHTIGVFVLGFATMFVSSYVLPQRLFPWLELTSGLLVVVIGLSMLWQRLTDFIRYGYVPQHIHDYAHDDAHEHEHPHEHGPHTHTHLPAEPDQPITLRGLLALGVSGGLVPCPSALVVMLGAIALGRIAFGMVLILAFSIGLAGILTGIGLLLVYARRLFERFPSDGRWIRGISAASAAIVTVVGLVISVGALAQLGFWK